MTVLLADAYASVEECRAWPPRIIDGDKDAQIKIALETVSRHIDRLTSRFFTHDDSAQARIFPGTGTRCLWTDDYVSLTSVKIDEGIDGTFSTTLATTDYQTLPLNAAKGPEQTPYNGIQLVYWGSRYIFPSMAQVQVTGIWGWPAIPSPIKAATIELTRILLLMSPRATNTVGDFGVMAMTNARARSIIEELIQNYGSVDF